MRCGVVTNRLHPAVLRPGAPLPMKPSLTFDLPEERKPTMSRSTTSIWDGTKFNASASGITKTGLSKEMSFAIEGGFSRSEKKAAWPFDVYQASDYFPVDYKYWERKYNSDIGATFLATMHAVKWSGDDVELAADTINMKNKAYDAHIAATYDLYGKIGLDLDPYRQFPPLDPTVRDWAETIKALGCRSTKSFHTSESAFTSVVIRK